MVTTWNLFTLFPLKAMNLLRFRNSITLKVNTQKSRRRLTNQDKIGWLIIISPCADSYKEDTVQNIIHRTM